MSLITPDLKLATHLQSTDASLSEACVSQIHGEVITTLKQRSPLLANTVEVRVARHGKQNYINLRVRRQFSNMLFHFSQNNLMYCFLASDKMDSTVILVVLLETASNDPRLRKLADLAPLQTAVHEFLNYYQIAPVGYTYTRDTDRKDPTLSHSRHFHLKLHFDWPTFIRLMPSVSMHDYDILKDLDPIKYSSERKHDTWDEVLQKMQADLD